MNYMKKSELDITKSNREEQVKIKFLL